MDRTVTHSTFVIERTYPHSPERVFAAFSNPDKKRLWYAGSEKRAIEEFEMDFRVGGHDRLVFRFQPGTQFAGTLLTNHTTYQDIVPNRRIVVAYTMTMGEHRFSASLATFEFQASGDGTNLVFTDQGAYFENSDGAQIREEGWRGILEALARECDAEAGN